MGRKLKGINAKKLMENGKISNGPELTYCMGRKLKGIDAKKLCAVNWKGLMLKKLMENGKISNWPELTYGQKIERDWR